MKFIMYHKGIFLQPVYRKAHYKLPSISWSGKLVLVVKVLEKLSTDRYKVGGFYFLQTEQSIAIHGGCGYTREVN